MGSKEGAEPVPGLAIFWLRDEGLEDSGNPRPGDLAQVIVDDLETALEQFRKVAAGSTEEAVIKKLK